MAGFAQEIRFATASDGVRIAYAMSGRGYPVVRAGHWLSNVERDLESPVGPWLIRLSASFRLHRYDPRGCGVSEGEGLPVSNETFVADLAATVEAARLDRFALIGPSGGSMPAIVYAALHPDRVSHLVIVGGISRGLLRRDPALEQRERFAATLKLVELGWGQDHPAFLQLFTSQFFPGATLEQMRGFNDLQRHATSPRHAARMIEAINDTDVSEYLPRVRCPTLVLHCRGDLRCPIEEGRSIAKRIPGARLVTLESPNHVPLEGEPAYEQLNEAIEAFPPRSAASSAAERPFAELTPRERDVLEHLARGEDNLQIAAHLGISEKTVRNNVTSIFAKICVENRGQAIVRAREHGLGVKPGAEPMRG